MHPVYAGCIFFITGEEPSMLITKFNKLIHNKIVWAVFAVLVSLSMVGMFAPSAVRSRRAAARPDTAGKLFGQAITRQEYNNARLFSRHFQPLPPDMTDEDREKFNEQVWQRLAILQLAEQMGIGVSDAELSTQIQSNPALQTNGRFDRRRYQQLVESQMRVRVPTFEKYLRQEMILSKISSLVTDSIWVSPIEVEDSVKRLTDLFTVEIVNIPYSNTVSDIRASEEEVRKFYEENKEAFEIPEMRSVKYVSWPVSNYLANVTVSQPEIEDYYNENIDQYSSTDTNGTVTYQPLEDVTNTIKNILVLRKAKEYASEQAMQFTDDLGMMDYGNTNLDFDRIAAKDKLAVHTSKLFSADGAVPDLNVDHNFNEAAFRLKPAPAEDSYSHSIVTDQAVYVLAFNKSEPPRIPPFENVKKPAKEYADMAAKNKAFEKKLKNLRKQMVAAISTGGDIDKLAEKLGLKVQKPKPFSVYESSVNGDNKEIAAIAPALISLNKGEISEPVPTDTGAAIIYVINRQPGDFALAESLKPEVAKSIQSSRVQAQFNTWAEDVLRQARKEVKK